MEKLPSAVQFQASCELLVMAGEAESRGIVVHFQERSEGRLMNIVAGRAADDVVSSTDQHGANVDTRSKGT